MMRLLAATVVLLASVDAHGAELGDESPQPPPVARPLTLTLSLVPLFSDTFELTGEVAASRKVGLALRGAYATIEGTTHPRAEYRSLAGQARYYAIGSFVHGVPIGLDLAYGHGATDGATANYADDAHPTGVVAGSFVGYKYTAPFGLTIDLQLGARFVLLKPKQLDASGHALVPVDEESILPWFNVAVGWAF